MTVTNREPVEGSLITFSCMFDVELLGSLSHVVWSLGPQIDRSATIVEWTADQPYIVNYNHGYSSPTYQMTIADLDEGRTDLSIYPVVLHDSGRYWCYVFHNGTGAFAYEQIQVSGRYVMIFDTIKGMGKSHS